MPERFGKTIAPVYAQVGTGFMHEGTAVLVTTGASFWLLSAAHTLLEESGPRWILAKPNFRLRPALWHGDPLDLAFLKLSAPEAEALIKCGQDFLPFDRIDVSGADTGNGKMIVTGFPAGTVEVDGAEHTVQVVLTKLTSRFFTHEELKVRKINPRLQLAGPYKISTDQNGKKGQMDMRGLSGGGIWHARNDDDVRLVGIVNQFDLKQKILIGTQIRPLILEMKNYLERGG